MDYWKKKLTSRKFWAAILAAGLAAYLALRGDVLDAGTLESLRTAVGALIAYICGESAVDVSRSILAKNAPESVSPKAE